MSRTQSCTHHFGELEPEEGRKERREAAVPRQSGPEPCSEPPSYLSRASDVTYANGADQMTRWNIFNFLRAHGEESSKSRPLEGDGGIFRSNNCVKTLRLVCRREFFKLVSWKLCFYLPKRVAAKLQVKMQKCQQPNGPFQRGSEPRQLLYKVVFLNSETCPPLMVTQQWGKKLSEKLIPSRFCLRVLHGPLNGVFVRLSATFK